MGFEAVSAVFDRLCRALAALPGVGRRSAERMALGLAQNRGMLKELALALDSAEQALAHCSRCGNLTDRTEGTCKICADSSRRTDLLCVVETLDELRVLQRMPGFDGYFFCLLGQWSPVRGESVPEERIQKLLARIRTENVGEVLLAMGADAEGEAAFLYLRERLSVAPCRITRLATGIPAGSGLAHMDPITLSNAMRGRHVAE